MPDNQEPMVIKLGSGEEIEKNTDELANKLRELREEVEEQDDCPGPVNIEELTRMLKESAERMFGRRREPSKLTFIDGFKVCDMRVVLPPDIQDDLDREVERLFNEQEEKFEAMSEPARVALFLATYLNGLYNSLVHLEPHLSFRRRLRLYAKSISLFVLFELDQVLPFIKAHGFYNDSPKEES